jgi:UDP-3-O-[3-hydroxymyristoyl] N-acetylglucosamine deacetylase
VTQSKPHRPQQRQRQTTLRRCVTLSGRGAHSDAPARLTLSPAGAGVGLLFQRAEAETAIEALWTRVTATQLRMQLGDGAASVATIEHVTAALAGLGVDNAVIEIDGPEAPAMDGSALPFVAAIRDAGLRRLATPRRRLKILETVRICDGAAFAELAPAETPGLTLDVEIDFPHALIGRQRLALTLSPETFAHELAGARSFGFLGDAERLWRQGLALGASLENSVILDARRALNPEGLRFSDEFVRHKALDVVGDLALAGAPIEGAFRSTRGGHGLNLALIERLMTTPSAYVLIGGEEATQHARRRPAAAAP